MIDVDMKKRIRSPGRRATMKACSGWFLPTKRTMTRLEIESAFAARRGAPKYGTDRQNRRHNILGEQ